MDFTIKLEEIYECNSIIIGSGAAGLNCALHLLDEGLDNSDILILTDFLGGGTSFNTGSDKQTYYKLAIYGEELDSPLEMALDLFNGGAMHGDIALVEATNSIREFFHLIHLGLPFPHDEFGGYVGYKTDNDPRQRATSIGPLTSRAMSEYLLKEVRNKKIPIHDKIYAIQILLNTEKKIPEAIGVICLEIDKLANNKDIKNFKESIKLYKARNIILATGGPAGIYKNSVYPRSQWGSTGLAIEAGAWLQNLTESQFGLASIDFRWNVSGSYQQVIPRYFSLDENNIEIEFLRQYFKSFEALSRANFLKGYQWPFNSERVENYGSSLIDLAVYYETETLGRKVYLDYTKNPIGYNPSKLDSTAKDYLTRSNALKEIPIDRLIALNEDAYHLYLNHNIDLKKDPLRIAVCNQHLNGGISGNIWWESSVKHLFAIGEVNGTHGIHRPGGSALNSGQVGGLRAAQKIGSVYFKTNDDIRRFEDITRKELNNLFIEVKPLFNKKKIFELPDQSHIQSQNRTLESFISLMRERMEKYGAIVRTLTGLKQEINQLKKNILDLNENISLQNNKELITYFKLRNSLLMQFLILSSIMEYHQSFGKSQGSYIIIRENLNSVYGENRIVLHENIEQFNFIKSNRNLRNKILQIKLLNPNNIQKDALSIELLWKEIKDIPKTMSWFENTWKKYKNGEVFRS